MCYAHFGRVYKLVGNIKSYWKPTLLERSMNGLNLHLKI